MNLSENLSEQPELFERPEQAKRFRIRRLLWMALSSVLLLMGFGLQSLAQMKGMEGMSPQETKSERQMPKKSVPVAQVPIKLTPRKQALIGLKTVKVIEKELEKVIRTIGRVDYNEKTLRLVTTKIEGWIEDLYIDAVGMAVKKGEPLFSLYSPKLVQAQEEYLLAIKESKKREGTQRGTGLAAASFRRLLLWDITPKQIEDLAARGKIARALPILSPAGGVVIEKMALAGIYVKPGMPLYKIADLSQVWIYVDIYEKDLSLIKLGQEVSVTLSSFPGDVRKGKITTLYPYLNKKTRTATVRLEFENADGRLKPGMYANVEIRTPLRKEQVVLESAILDSGLRQIVFVALAEGRFEPREVKIGQRINREVVVLEGLKTGEKVVTHGTFLIDSESKMMASMEGMMGLVGMGDWKMEGSKMGEMDMGGMDMSGMQMQGMAMKKETPMKMPGAAENKMEGMQEVEHD